MIFHYILRPISYLIISVLITIFLGLSSTISPVMAANYSGAYFGAFPEDSNFGAFAMLVRSDNSTVLIAYDSIFNYGFSHESINISNTGDFSQPIIDGLGSNVSGAVTSTGVSGFYSSSISSGLFSGSKSSFIGPYSNEDGYYKGTFFMNCGPYPFSGNGYFRTIASADGTTFLYIEFTQSSIPGWPAGSKDGGFLSLSGYDINGVTYNGVSVSGALSGTAVNGTLAFSVCSGSFTGSLVYELTEPENILPIGAIQLLLLD